MQIVPAADPGDVVDRDRFQQSLPRDVPLIVLSAEEDPKITPFLRPTIPIVG